MDRPSHFVTGQSAETPGTGPQTGNLGTAGTSACATLWRTLQRAGVPSMGRALMPTLGISLVLLTSCGSEPPRRSATSPTTPVAVQVATVSTQAWPAVYEATGTVRARTAGTVSSQVMGYVQQVSVQVGDHVREGQILVTLDARELEEGVRGAEAGRAEASSAIPEAESAVAAAKANLDLAQTTFKRIEDLAAKKSISNQEFDEASARVKAAQANYEMARSKRAQLDPRLARAEQELRSATIMRDYAKIAAPFAGIVTAKSVEPGNLATPGVPLLTIERDGVYRLEASVDESRLPSARAGAAVEVALEGVERRLNARVSEVVPAVDAASRSSIVKIDLPAVPQLRSGMFGRAFFPLGSREVVVAPASAIVERGQLQSVFVVEDGTARTRLVTTGQRAKDTVEVLSGLSAGEKIVAPIPAGLEDGARLEVRP
jgi:RND family efflux transporter MFP subunit